MNVSKQIYNQSREVVSSYLKKKNVDLIELRLFRRGKTTVVRCLVDYPEGGITIADCSALNKDLFRIFERQEILGEDFAIEVNSPGIDRKLKDVKDFRRIKGKLLSIWLKVAVDQKNYMEGFLEDVIDDDILINQGQQQRRIAISQIRTAKQKIDFKRNK
jgi:ribosome maturation factor RimP